jgi:hypothetical protein
MHFSDLALHLRVDDAGADGNGSYIRLFDAEG